MNENNLNFNNNVNDNYNGNTYRATTNLNVAMENPQADINSATGINIQNTDSSFGINNGMNNSNLYNNGINDGSFSNSSVDNINTFQNNNFSENQISNSSFLDSGINNGTGVENTYVPSNQNNNDMFDNNSGNNGQSSFLPSGNGGQVTSNETANMYAPTLEQNKKPKAGLTISKELKAMIIIIVILVIFVLVMPYVYDLLKESGLIITSG